MTLSVNQGLTWESNGLSILGTNSLSVDNRLIIASNRNRIPYSTTNSGSTNFMKYYGTAIYAPADTAIDSIEIDFHNSLSLPTGGLSTTGCIPFYLRVGLEYPLDGAIYPMHEFGNRKIDMVVGKKATVRTSNNLIIPAGAQFRIRMDMEHYTAGGSTYNVLLNTLYAPSRRDHATSGADNTVIKAYGGVSYPDFATTTLGYGFTCIRARPLSSNIKTIFILSDSIGRGSGDTVSTTQQGDYLSGTSPTAPYINVGNVGWVERSLGKTRPYFSMAVQGRQIVNSVFTDAILGSQFSILDNAKPTEIMLALGVNDLMAGRTPAQIISDINAAIAILKNRYGSQVKITVPTITPVTNSTDSWATTLNQTFTGSPGGATVTWSNFNDGSGATGRLSLNSQIMAGGTNADYTLDVASYCQDSGDSRLWRVDLGAPVGDGIHPKDAIVKAIVTGVGTWWH